jgi:hypothetical protein
MSPKRRKGTGRRPLSPSTSKSRAPRKRTRLTLTTATTISTLMASALAVLITLAGLLHHLMMWILHP